MGGRRYQRTSRWSWVNWNNAENHITVPWILRACVFFFFTNLQPICFAESINFIFKTGAETIFQHNKLLTDRLIEGMLEIGAKITSPLNDKDRTSIVRAHIKPVDTYQLKNGLQNEQVFVSTRGNSIRFSPHLYNTLDDIDKTINEIKKWVRNN